ncbi:hypothetical protein BGY98DRAFT_3353 [Russula aff. rugulosa BPL654]|nr:hypothetical protein BGY98DRAFT_3353 [Russula aff. rugulosa BPL654]
MLLLSEIRLNSGCRDFVRETYDVREFFSGVLRDNVILGIQVLFSTSSAPYMATERHQITVTPIPYLSLSDDSSSRSPYTFQLISEKRCPTSVLLPPQVEADVGLSLGKTLLTWNLPGLLVLRAYAIVRGKMSRTLAPSRVSRILDHHVAPHLLILRRSSSCHLLSTGYTFNWPIP